MPATLSYWPWYH